MASFAFSECLGYRVLVPRFAVALEGENIKVSERWSAKPSLERRLPLCRTMLPNFVRPNVAPMLVPDAFSIITMLRS